MSRTALFTAMAKLRSVLHAIEEELGVSELKSSELDVLAAVIELSPKGTKHLVTATQLIDHPLTSKLGRSTTYRAIGSLEKMGLLVTGGPGYNVGYSVNFGSK